MKAKRTCHEALAAAFAACALLIGGCGDAGERELSVSTENTSRSNVAAQSTSAGGPAAIEVAPVAPPRPSAESLSDVVITARIRAALVAEPGMAGSDVSVTTSHGAVVLNGTVKSYEQSGMASAFAQRQDGVMRVDNQLVLLVQ